MGASGVADKEAMLAALAQVEVLTAQMNRLSIDGFSPGELLQVQERREAVLRAQPVLDHKVYQRLRSETTPKSLGATSFKKVLMARLRISGEDAARRLKDAELLGPRIGLTGEPLAPKLPTVARGQAQGLIGPDHIAHIRRFFKKLPSCVDYQARDAAEVDLGRHACGLDPDGFKQVADRLRYLLNQDGEFTDIDRAAQRYLHYGRQRFDGMVPVKGLLTPEAAAAMEALNAKLAAPGMCNPADEFPQVDGEPDPVRAGTDIRTQGQRLHDALVAAGRALLASGELGQLNGLPATIIVTTTLKELETGAGQGLTAGGTLLPMSEVLRLASHAYHYLVIFDGKGVPLHLGRARRTASAGQRIVLLAKHRGCTAPGCTAPGYRCQVHHANRDWKDGGLTDIEDLTLACGPDNRMVETTGWTTRNRADDGVTEWIPPPELECGQTRINTYHHPDRILAPDDP
ncbi:HNH endonuclease signature motif containing protein [Mycolicibacterium mengxianglii]|uniref:HNH endonuclease signature motif containing protein n=1 Tax=Mycolicibacterium mengxianglii TaxID=2736649 RepID=UPI0018D00BB4|nr:HNH endonuclease signature motif containing protein [Mycolicibacterium mengxianglii]